MATITAVAVALAKAGLVGREMVMTTEELVSEVVQTARPGREQLAVDMDGNNVLVTVIDGRDVFAYCAEANFMATGDVRPVGIRFHKPFFIKGLNRTRQLTEAILRPLVVLRGITASGTPLFLPPGEGEARENTGVGKKGRTPVKDNGRLAFLRNLPGFMGTTGGQFLGGREHYSAYFVRSGGSRKPLAVLECPWVGSGAYVLRADMSDWTEVAQLPRENVRTGGHPEFVARICHHEGWQIRLTDLIARS